jgi:hypothetical protein
MLALPCGPVDVGTGIVLTYDAIFPENDWQEKDVNQLALGSAGTIGLKAARATISLRRHAEIPV